MQQNAIGRRINAIRCWLAPMVRFAIAGFVVYLIIRSQRGWSDAAYWAAGLQQAHAGNWAGIYDPAVNEYAMRGYSPVSLYLLLYPLGYLSERGIRAVLAVAIVGMWAIAYFALRHCLRDAEMTATESDSQPSGPLPGMVLCQRFLGSDLLANQINVISFTPACLGLGLMLRRSWWRTMIGSALLAATAGMKMYPVALIALLWVKRAWREAAVATCLTAGVLWFVPWALLGPTEFAHVRAQQAASAGSRMWMHDESYELWGLPNVLYYRCYLKPVFAGTESIPPTWFQAGMAGLTLAVGLFVLPVLLRQTWRDTTPRSLLEDISVIGVALCLVDPVGRTAHFVMAVPAHCLLLSNWINDWRRNGISGSRARWMIYGFVLFVNNFLLVSLPGIRHDWYANYGVFSMGMLALLVLVRRDILKHQILAANPLTTAGVEPHLRVAA